MEPASCQSSCHSWPPTWIQSYFCWLQAPQIQMWLPTTTQQHKPSQVDCQQPFLVVLVPDAVILILTTCCPSPHPAQSLLLLLHRPDKSSSSARSVTWPVDCQPLSQTILTWFVHETLSNLKALLKSRYIRCTALPLSTTFILCEKEIRLVWQSLFSTNPCWLFLTTFMLTKSLLIICSSIFQSWKLSWLVYNSPGFLSLTSPMFSLLWASGTFCPCSKIITNCSETTLTIPFNTGGSIPSAFLYSIRSGIDLTYRIFFHLFFPFRVCIILILLNLISLCIW